MESIYSIRLTPTRKGSRRISSGRRLREGAIEFWEDALSKALAGRPALIRIVGEMASERKLFSTDSEMMRYEVAFNLIAKRFPTVTLCQYDVRGFDGVTVLQAMKAHPDQFDLGLQRFLL